MSNHALASHVVPQPVSVPGFGDYFDLREIVTNAHEHDTFRVAGNAPLPREIELFRVPQGRQGSGFARDKTFAETSLTLAGKLSMPMTVLGLIFELTPIGQAATDPATARYLHALRANLQLVFEISGSLAIGPRPLNQFQELGFSGVTNQANPVAEAVIGGAPTHEAFRLRTPCAVPGKMNFTIDLVPDRNMPYLANVPDGADFLVRAYLAGHRQQTELA